MAGFLNYLNCCGIRENAQIRSDRSARQALLRVNGEGAPFSLFSDTSATGYKYGRRLAKIIRDNNLGELTETVEGQNYANKIIVWVWCVDKAALKAYLTPKRRKKAA